MITVPLNFVAAPFSVDPTWTVEQFHQALVNSITSSVTDSNVILGQIGGTLPATDIGPWLNGTTWYAWNASASPPAYQPAVIRIGSGTGSGDTVKYVTLTAPGSLTQNRTVSFQDKNGQVALLGDVFGGRAHVDLATATVPYQINWAVSNNFSGVFSADHTLTMVGSLPGQEIFIALKDSGSHAVTWPDSVLWDTATPTQTASKTNVYDLVNIAGTIYGTKIGAY